MSDRRFLVGLVLIAAFVGGSFWMQTWPGQSQTKPERPAPPAPTEGPGEQGPSFASRRAAWIESLHRAAPGVDRKAMDAAARTGKMLARAALREQLLASGLPKSLWDAKAIQAVPSGTWVERGSGGQAGRVVAAEFDAANNRA